MQKGDVTKGQESSPSGRKSVRKGCRPVGNKNNLAKRKTQLRRGGGDIWAQKPPLLRGEIFIRGRKSELLKVLSDHFGGEIEGNSPLETWSLKKKNGRRRMDSLLSSSGGFL